MPLDLSATGVDFYTGGPLKWLCGGPGLAYLYVREELIPHLEPRITSWFATEGQFDFDPRGFRYRVRRPPLRVGHARAAHGAYGPGRPGDRGRSGARRGGGAQPAPHRRHLIARCDEAGFELRLAPPERRSAIVMIRHADPAGAVRHLAEHGVIVDHRPGFVRVSPHFYNTEDEVDRCVDVLAGYAG